MADFDVTKPMNEAETKEAIRYYVDVLETAQKENYDEILRLTKEKQDDKILELLKIDEFISLDDKNPELVAGVMNAFGYRKGLVGVQSLYVLCLQAISKRKPEKNFRLAEYVDLAAYIGQKSDIRDLSKEERYAFNRLWEKFERFQNRKDLKGDYNAWVFLDELIDRGDLLNCKNLTPEQRAVVIDKYLNPRMGDKFKNRLNLLENLDEKYISEALVEEILRGPAGFFEKELGTPWLQFTDKRGVYTKEYQKFEKAAMRVIEQMPRYDQNSPYGREMGLNERFDALVKKTHYKTFQNLAPTDINPLVRKLYLKTAEQDIVNGNADKLSYWALALVLQNDKQGYYARKISPEIYEAAKKSATQSGQKRLFDSLRTAEFLIYRHQAKSAYDISNIVRSDAFLKLTVKEREEMSTLAMLTEFAKLVHFPENEQKEIADALRLVNEGKKEERIPKSSKTAEELILDVLQAYGYQKEYALRRVDNAQKVEMIIQDHQRKVDAYARAVQKLEHLQQIYQTIGEDVLSQQSAEKVISDIVHGQKTELKLPDFGKLPIFGRDKERERRANIAKAVKSFNTIAFFLDGDKEVMDILKTHQNYLSEQSNTDLRFKQAKEYGILTDIQARTEGYNKVAIGRADLCDRLETWLEGVDENLEVVIRDYWKEDYNSKPARPVNGLEPLYKFIEDSTYIESKFKIANVEYGSYIEALKAVAHERVGIDESGNPMTVVVKGQKQTTAQQRAENARKNKDKLFERQEKGKSPYGVSEAKEQIFKAQETIKRQKESQSGGR